MKYVEDIGLANARDVSKMVRWNDKYGIKFMRLSSEMFPFAATSLSHSPLTHFKKWAKLLQSWAIV